MRLPILSAVGLCVCAAVSARGQDPFDGPVAGGNYVRVAVGTASVIAPSGVYQEYSRPAYALSVAYEGWDVSRDGQERQGVGFSIQYARMPLDATYFSQNFLTAGQDHPTQASGTGALYRFEIEVLHRIPMAVVNPTWHFGFGLFDLPNATVHYQSSSTTGSIQLVSRYGPLFSGGLGLDRSITSRVGAFVEGRYSLGVDASSTDYTVRSAATSCTSSCSQGSRFAQVADVRAGVRVHVH